MEYTLTIESTGGSGIVVPGRGFLLNNELTDFNYDAAHDPNRSTGGKRPRSSMSPTIVIHGDRTPSPSARPAARRSSRPSCRCCSTGSTSA